MRTLCKPLLLGLALTAASCSGDEDDAEPNDGRDGAAQTDGNDGQPGDGGEGDGADGSQMPPDDGEEVTTQGVTVFETSRAGAALDDKGAQKVFTGATPLATRIVIDPAEERQQILGFGGAITESSATVLAELDETERQKVIDAYFSPQGANYTIARTHIASCDFSVASYQYSTVADETLADFSIDHDKTLLIPTIKSAQESAGGALKVVAAPWSAPAWMKNPEELFVKPAASNNYAGIDPRLKPEYVDTYALYLTKYLEAYEAEGIKVWGLSPQNEPLGNGGNWETMRWDPVGMRNFIRDNLGPKLEAGGFDTKLMIFDHNKGPVTGDMVSWTKAILNDPEAAKYVWGTATHWYASTFKVYEESLDEIHDFAPDKAILPSEHTIDGLSDRKAMPPSEAYDGSWMDSEFYWTKSAYDWGYWWATGTARADHPVYEPVYRYARDIIQGLNHWYAGWIDWNIVLDETGGPNHQNNLCAAPVMINTTTKKVYYTPLFHVMSHFSKFILPDARVLGVDVTLDEKASIEGYDGAPTDGLIATAAKNPDGSYAVVLFNQTAAPLPYDVVIGEFSSRGTIPAQALQTLVWKASE